jgi:hypothetical protein
MIGIKTGTMKKMDALISCSTARSHNMDKNRRAPFQFIGDIIDACEMLSRQSIAFG